MGKIQKGFRFVRYMQISQILYKRKMLLRYSAYFLVLASAATASDINFDQFIQKFKKSYTQDEYRIREQIFNKNLKNYKEHNSSKKYKFTMGINKFSDLEPEEFINQHTMPTSP